MKFHPRPKKDNLKDWVVDNIEPDGRVFFYNKELGVLSNAIYHEDLDEFQAKIVEEYLKENNENLLPNA